MPIKAITIIIAATALTADQQKRPLRVAAGATTEVCGRVTAFSDGPGQCEASLRVEMAGEEFTVSIPASVRRAAARATRQLKNAQACFTGVVTLPPGGVVIRVADPAAIRVLKPADAAERFGDDAVDFCQSEVVAPRVLHEEKPQYTSEAMRARVEGVVELEAIVDATGAVARVRVAKPLHAQLDEQAVKALRSWKFAPGTLQGRPVAVLVSIEMTFSIRARR